MIVFSRASGKKYSCWICLLLRHWLQVTLADIMLPSNCSTAVTIHFLYPSSFSCCYLHGSWIFFGDTPVYFNSQISARKKFNFTLYSIFLNIWGNMSIYYNITPVTVVNQKMIDKISKSLPFVSDVMFRCFWRM